MTEVARGLHQDTLGSQQAAALKQTEWKWFFTNAQGSRGTSLRRLKPDAESLVTQFDPVWPFSCSYMPALLHSISRRTHFLCVIQDKKRSSEPNFHKSWDKYCIYSEKSKVKLSISWKTQSPLRLEPVPSAHLEMSLAFRAASPLPYT